MSSPSFMRPLAQGPNRCCAQQVFRTLPTPVSRRHQSTYKRTKSRLNVKPDPSFLPSTSEPYDHIIHNPPASQPSVYHTPTLFLPPNDPRRKLRPSSSASKALPAPVRKPYEKRYHLTEAQILEMRQLRFGDPMQWSVTKLAKKYDCSTLFVSLCTEGAATVKKEQQKQVLEAVKASWVDKRRNAREERVVRRESWARDE